MLRHALALALALALSVAAVSPAFADLPEGMVRIHSAHDVPTTVERLTEAVKAAGMTHFATVDHAAGAKAAGEALRPTTLVIFGNPRAGTPLMQQAQTAGLDLPLRVLVYEDADGATHLAWDDPDWIAKRHSATEANTLPAMREALPRLLGEVAGAGEP